MKYFDFVDKAPKIPALVIVEGTERELADHALNALETRIRLEDPSVEITRFRAPALESFRAVAEGIVALGFFASRRVFIVRDVHELRVAARRSLWEIAQTVALPSTLILEDLMAPTKKTKPEPLSQLSGRETLKIDTTAGAPVRTRYLEETVKAAGARIDPGALRQLVDGGADLATIRNDLERLALDDAPITANMLARESFGAEDPKAYRFAGALVAGQDAQALAIAAELFADDPRGAAVPLLSALATEYSLLWELARGNGTLPARHRWRERMLKPLAQSLGARVARRGFERAIRGFEAVVTGRADDPRVLVEMISAECAYERAAAARRR